MEPEAIDFLYEIARVAAVLIPTLLGIRLLLMDPIDRQDLSKYLLRWRIPRALRNKASFWCYGIALIGLAALAYGFLFLHEI